MQGCVGFSLPCGMLRVKLSDVATLTECVPAVCGLGLPVGLRRLALS